MINIDTGDSVFHRPSREWWKVAHVDGNRLYWCGWPDGNARLGDCLLVTKATPAERLSLLLALANSAGKRASAARAALEQKP